MPQQIQAGQPGQMTIQPAGQPGQMTMQPVQSAMGQPGQPMTMGQFQVIQPQMIAPGGQYATFPQQLSYDQQGRLVLQPAQFMQQAGQPGQPGQIILSGMPQPQPGKPNMMGSQPSTPGKPISAAQPQFTMTSTGQLQMQPNGQPGQQTFIMAPPPQMMAGPGPGPMPGQVTSMPGGHQPQASMAQMKGSDGKPVMAGPPQAMPPQSPQQPFLVAGPNGQMMQMMQPGPQPMINGGQLIFRSPAGPGDQQIMFSPSIPATAAPPQTPNPQNLPSSAPMQSPMTMPGQPRPSLPSGPPPGKTAISRAIAPLPSSVTQSGPRMGYTGPAGNLPNQPSPKSKQKMSPRGTNIGPGRPPGPKSVNAPKMMPKMPGSPLATDLLNASSPKPPNLQNEIITSMANIQGPPTLTPMMIPALSTPLTSTQAPPQSMIVTMPSIPVKPLYQMSWVIFVFLLPVHRVVCFGLVFGQLHLSLCLLSLDSADEFVLEAVCALDIDMGVLLRPWSDRDAIDIGDRLLPAVEPDRLLLPNLLRNVSETLLSGLTNSIDGEARDSAPVRKVIAWRTQRMTELDVALPKVNHGDEVG